ncbi:HPr family phosphocarrier protein [Paenibacillus tarimensis]|uniref:HPr family phosphocarrier protein n=1 Tax=Paenibacillus tarimensis TaxID=416012 RepID=UPI001F2DD922|nr:HPr family phosphocarrier protein [Paenibacillus tarimensis]MCF2944497.1 HPr family phosphocarrier protein [Paenibacillus tarimensis]
MATKKIVIRLSEDKTIAELGKILTGFNSEVMIKKNEGVHYKEANLKSILGLINLRLNNGDGVTIEGVGEEAEEAVEVVATFLGGTR